MNLNPDLEIHDDTITTIREIEPGDWYILVRRLRQGGKILDGLRQRTENNFKALTIRGSIVIIFPSDRCHPVTIQEPESEPSRIITL